MPIVRKLIFQKSAKNTRIEVNFFTGHPVCSVKSSIVKHSSSKITNTYFFSIMNQARIIIFFAHQARIKQDNSFLAKTQSRPRWEFRHQKAWDQEFQASLALLCYAQPNRIPFHISYLKSFFFFSIILLFTNWNKSTRKLIPRLQTMIPSFFLFKSCIFFSFVSMHYLILFIYFL